MSCPFNNYHNDSTQCRYCGDISLDCLSCHARVCANPSDPALQSELKDQRERVAALQVAVDKMRKDLTALGIDIEAVNADVKRLVDAKAAEQEAAREWRMERNKLMTEETQRRREWIERISQFNPPDV